jgi:hypothetical protein
MSNNIPTLGADQQVETNGKKENSTGVKIFNVVFLLICIFGAFSFVSMGAANKSKSESPVEKYMFHAGVDCKPLIERHAKYSVKWTDGLLGGIFSKAGQNGNVISYYGDKVQLQNGFGAYATYSYKCNYNTVTGTTDLVALEKGRL